MQLLAKNMAANQKTPYVILYWFSFKIILCTASVMASIEAYIKRFAEETFLCSSMIRRAKYKICFRIQGRRKQSRAGGGQRLEKEHSIFPWQVKFNRI